MHCAEGMHVSDCARKGPASPWEGADPAPTPKPAVSGAEPNSRTYAPGAAQTVPGWSQCGPGRPRTGPKIGLC